MKIELTCGYYAIVDDEDYEWLSQSRWHYKQGYAARSSPGKKTLELMHRQILNAPPGMRVDHISGDKLDNRRINLRLATPAENTRNNKRRKDSKMLYKGISEKGNRYTARIQVDGKGIHLGSYTTAEAAARVYDRAAVKYHGDFARLNFPNESLWTDTQVEAAKYVSAKKTSRFRGVCWYPKYQKWCAKIGIDGRKHFLGYFDTEIDAATAYNKAVIHLRGSSATANDL